MWSAARTARATASFTGADAGDAIGVEVSGLALTGPDAHNYVLASTAATTTADIAPAILTPTLTVSSKTYDGTHAATITGCSLAGVIGADVVGCATARATATFTSPGAGDAIGVEVTGLGLTGWDAHNYVLASTSATTTADIAPAILTVVPDAQTLTYGAAAPAYTFAVTGFQNGETPATASNYCGAQRTSTYFSLDDRGIVTGEDHLRGGFGGQLHVRHQREREPDDHPGHPHADADHDARPHTVPRLGAQPHEHRLRHDARGIVAGADVNGSACRDRGVSRCRSAGGVPRCAGADRPGDGDRQLEF